MFRLKNKSINLKFKYHLYYAGKNNYLNKNSCVIFKYTKRYYENDVLITNENKQMKCFLGGCGVATPL